MTNATSVKDRLKRQAIEEKKTYVKSAVFTLCGMDVFEIIRKYTSGYVSKSANDDSENLYVEYEAVKKEVDKLEVRESVGTEEFLLLDTMTWEYQGIKV